MPCEAPSSVLLVEDSPDLAWTYQRFLAKAQIAVDHVATGAGALRHLEGRRPAAVFLDLGLPDMDGLEALTRLAARAAGAPIVVITANDNLETAVRAMKGGARDYLTKPFNAERMLTALQGVLTAGPLPGAGDPTEASQALLGASPGIVQVRHMIDRAAGSDATVFLTGESGTGKDLCAWAIHAASPRRDGPFVAVNCGGLARDLMESELFGHARGAFTGAVSARRGAARRAAGGTLFLDEICEMDLAIQAKLLRFTQDLRATPLGSDHSQHVDLRLICATNKDPWAEVTAGRLRADLYYRLHVVPLHIPPLRARGGDVMLLARSFLERLALPKEHRRTTLTADAEDFIVEYSWPGNVRELHNALCSAAVLSDGATLSADALRAIVRPRRDGGDPPQASGGVRPLKEVERLHIEAAIARCKGNVARAAQLLEVDPSTIYRKRNAWHSGPPA